MVIFLKFTRKVAEIPKMMMKQVIFKQLMNFKASYHCNKQHYMSELCMLRYDNTLGLRSKFNQLAKPSSIQKMNNRYLNGQ